MSHGRDIGEAIIRPRLSIPGRLGLILLHSGLKQLKMVTDYQEYGGAPFLGFSHIVLKAHGRSGVEERFAHGGQHRRAVVRNEHIHTAKWKRHLCIVA